MGQRLVIDLIQDDKIIAAIYYHWSAYFCSTVYELANLSEALLEAQKENKNKLKAIMDRLGRLQERKSYNGETEKVCGGLRGGPNFDEERKAVARIIPNYSYNKEQDKHVNRSYGLISFTEEGIKGFHDWEEGHAEINLDTLEVSHDVTLDPDPFEFDVDATENEDGYVEDYVFNSGKIKINGKTLPIDAFDGTCESFVELFKLMDDELTIYNNQHAGNET